MNAAPRRQQRQRAALAELVRLLAFCDQHGLDFNQLANEAQEIHRELKADESVPAFLRRLTS